MQLGQIEAFVEVARLGSVSRAAENLCLTQPSVTDRLRALEEEIGNKLFTRVKYGVTLTDAGKTLLPYAQRILKHIVEARVALDNLTVATQGSISIGAAFFIGLYVLPSLLERFTSTYPGVRVSVRTGHSEEILDMVLRDEVQIGLSIRLKHPDIETVKLYDDEFVLVVPASHPFSHLPSVTMEQVAQEEVVTFDRASSYYKLVNAVFVDVGLALRGRFEMDTVEMAKKIVEKGMGISLLPRVAVEGDIASGILNTVPIEDRPPLKREMVACYRRASGLGGIARAFLQCVEEFSSPYAHI